MDKTVKKKAPAIAPKTVSSSVIPPHILQEWREHTEKMDKRIGELQEDEYYDVFSIRLSDGLDRIRYALSLIRAAALGEDLDDDAREGIGFLGDDVDLKLRRIDRTIVHEMRRRDAEAAGLDYWQEMQRKEAAEKNGRG